MFKKILIPLDGTELADGILPYVTQLAKGLDIAVTLLSVIDPDTVELPERYTGRPGPDQSEIVPQFDSMEEKAKDHLSKIAKRLKKGGVESDTVVIFGNAAEEIVEVAEHEGCDLIAMSTHGRNALGRGILGSVTDKVIHSAHIPTMTITPDRAKDYWRDKDSISRIVVPLDGSPLSENVLPYIDQMARRMSLEIVLVRAVRFPASYGTLAVRYPSAVSFDIEAEVEAEAVNYLKEKAADLRSKGLKVAWRLLRGAPAMTIVEFAKETPQDLVVLASHGRSGITRWVLGSVAESLIRASGDPVLVIPSR